MESWQRRPLRLGTISRDSQRDQESKDPLMKWPWIVVWAFVALVIAGLVGIPLVHLIGWR
jgi:hypothetical protein